MKIVMYVTWCFLIFVFYFINCCLCNLVYALYLNVMYFTLSYFLHFISYMYFIQFTNFIMHLLSTLYIVYIALYAKFFMHFIVCIVFHALYSMQFILWIIIIIIIFYECLCISNNAIERPADQQMKGPTDRQTLSQQSVPITAKEKL